MRALGKFFFKYRGYTPLPFLIVMLVFQKPSLISIISGFIILLAGETIRLYAVGYAGVETRRTSGVGGSRLVVSGPFAHVRNPLYIGNILIYLGSGVMSFALFPYMQIISVLYFIFQYYLIVMEEERFLREEFRDDYERYCDNVPRFIPRLKPYRVDAVRDEFNFKVAVRSERRTFQALTTVIVLILLFYFRGWIFLLFNKIF